MKNLDKVLASKSIYKMFQYDLRAKPDSTFTEHTETKNTLGIETKCYYKKLDYKECEVFDMLMIIAFEDKQDVIFSGDAPKNAGEVQRIIGDITLVLYTLFGKDDNSKGIFTSDELGAYNLGMFTRDYYSLEPTVSLNNLDNTISMSISGVEYNPTETKDDAKPKKYNNGCTLIATILLLLLLWYIFFY
jgi:hypothetical protein